MCSRTPSWCDVRRPAATAGAGWCSLTAAGRRLLAELERRSNARMLSLVEHLDDAEIAELLQSMDRIRALFTP